jgi:uncharacterized protein (DUF885 family)
MLEAALPLHGQLFPAHKEHPELSGRERENRVIGEVLQSLSEHHATRDQLLPSVQSGVEQIKRFIKEKEIVSLSPRDNLTIIPTPVFLRGVYSVAGFHGPPPLDPAAQAQYWVTPIDPKTPAAKAESKLREYNDWVLRWLTIHEALPGHYIQFEHANDVQPPLRRLIRSLYGNGPYIEGWAEYIAQVMMEEGFDRNGPRYRLSYLKIWLRSVVNAILDVRIQTMEMTDAEALDLMEHQAFQTQAEAEGKLQRAKLSSTQLPTYFVGTRQWWRLRREYQTAKGKDFVLREFHDRALNEGPIPLDDLRRILLPAVEE